MRKLNKNKKAMEMSINIIIMLIIGLTIMGLVIGFVTSFLGQAKGSVVKKLTQDDKAKIDQVNRKSGNFAFLTSTVQVEQGSETPGKLYVKIRNPTSTEFIFSDGGKIPESGNFKVSISKGNGGTDDGADKISAYSPPIILKQGESEGFTIDVYALKQVPLGTYYAKFTILEGAPQVEYNAIVTIRVI